MKSEAQLKAEIERLQRSVEEQALELESKNRELEIEAALERVRSASMAMHKSEELVQVVQILDKQILGLGIETEGTQIFTDFADPEKGVNDWFAKEGHDFLEKFHVPYLEHSLTKRLYDALAKGVDFYSDSYSKDEKNEFLKLIFTYSDFRTYPKESQDLIYNAPGMVRASVLSKNSILIFQRFDLKEFSKEEEDIFKRFGKVFEQAYSRFLDLQKAEAQAREAQIEVALEKVRSASMAMHKSEELVQVVRILDKQILGLGIEAWGTQIITDFPNPENGFNVWLAVEGQDYLEKFHVPFIKHPSFNKSWTAVQNGADFYTETYSKADKDEFYKLVFKFSDFKSIPKERQNFAYNSPGMVKATVLSKNSILIFQRFDLKKFSKEEEEIFKRFGKVFEQAYTRFLDLQKAEAQAREAQIEVALEKVRSASMAMHKSEELQKVVSVLFEQLQSLNFALDGAAFIATKVENSQGFDFWMEDKVTQPSRFRLPYYDSPVTNDFSDAWEKGKDFSAKIFGKEKNIWFKYAFEHTDLKIVPEDRKQWVLAQSYLTQAFALQKNSLIGIHAHYEKVLTANEIDILKRFSKVFEQSFVRFLDLQKAENQARESQIEAALERVRSRSLAMHKSEELRNVVNTLYGEFQSLHVNFHVAAIQLFPDDSMDMYLWLSTADGLYDDIIHWPFEDLPIFHEVYKSRATKVIEYTLDKKETEEFLEAYFKLEAVPKERKDATRSVEVIDIFGSFFEKAGIFIMRYSKGAYSENEKDIIRRFAKVFEQTYIRFLDLQKAEAQAREAIKQSSLDRVRGEIASMRDAKDLERITPLVWKELQSLGVPFFRCGVMLVNEEEEVIDFYLSNPQGEALAALRLDFNTSEITQKGVVHWRNKETYVEHWNQDQFIAFMKSLIEVGQVKDVNTYQGGETAPEALTLQFVPFTQGMLYVGSLLELSAEELDLVKALGESLSVAYARYEDFVKLEQAKAEVESAMSELKATQSQLVQQEKLASLGQLTAGIAHEIKNPLNFVNNFSEVSIEMIEEALEEMEKPLLPISQDARPASPAGRDETLIKDNLEDIKSNLQKVHEHGSRANGIVTSMLQHSRGGSGKMDPTDLNALIKEYVNLSFHGMRAGKNPINVDIVLDLDPDLGMVSLIKEDFTRVVINLCNNAFDAMRQKTLQGFETLGGLEVYHPELTVRTKTEKNQIRISFEDNGPGIPDDIKDKILQPFFTTKKGTEGTGLGLSITHDIVKAHGGEIKIKTKENEGTTFTIEIPIV